jgi:regulator-associated protein of mTOR
MVFSSSYCANHSLTWYPQRSSFFEEQLTAFEVWLESGHERKAPPEQLPIILQVNIFPVFVFLFVWFFPPLFLHELKNQVLLSHVLRLRALVLLGRFLDLGPWAVNLVGTSFL